MPVLFVAHGSPYLLDNAPWMAELSAWAALLPQPRAILMVSAHWEQRPLTLGATERVSLVYDFYDFPHRYYEVTYPAPGAAALAARVVDLLSPTQPLAFAPRRGLDHGAYIPLIPMYPDADIPVLQISLPSLDPQALLAVGEKLAPLRDEGVLIIGSGFLSHNLRVLDPRPAARTPAWAIEFDAWTEDVLARQDIDALLDYRARAPALHLALPTHEHFAPVLVAQGAARAAAGPVRFPIVGYEAAVLTKRSVQYG